MRSTRTQSELGVVEVGRKETHYFSPVKVERKVRVPIIKEGARRAVCNRKRQE